VIVSGSPSSPSPQDRPDRGAQADPPGPGEYAVLSHTFRLEADDASLAGFLDRLLAPFRRPSSGTASSYVLATSPGGDFSVSLDGEPLEEDVSLPSAVSYFLWHVNRRVVEGCPELLVHAGAVTGDGLAVLLPAPPDSGKSTLVAGMVAAGFGYLSDEMVPLGGAPGLVDPYPKPMWLDRGSVEAVAGLLDRIPADDLRFMDRHWHVAPDVVRAGAVSGPGTAGLVVFPTYRPGGRTRLEPVSRGAALAELVRNSFNFPRFGHAGLVALRDLVAGCTCYVLEVADLGEAVGRVGEALDQRAHPG
jgi:hypothetical protein